MAGIDDGDKVHLSGRSFPSSRESCSVGVKSLDHRIDRRSNRDHKIVIALQSCQRLRRPLEKTTTNFRACLHFSRPRAWIAVCLHRGMRRLLALAIALSLASPGLSSTLLAAGQGQIVTITGRALSADQRGLANTMVRLRSVTTGQLLRVTTSAEGGSYSFPAVAPDTYIIELVDRDGRMVGTTEPFVVEANTAPTMSVVATSTSALTSSGSAGFSFLGLGPAMSTVVLGAAGAAAITGVVATRPDASPSN
jgi:hypothetical protein